ncbi:MAG: hypothetical protein A2060_00805 [Planctomycetes bacterium GWA2_50_13]|nr:MAG: hypothetical protein A2060_00805 [Planctomycetes bacterium GWA2_50_13]HCN18761.1 hypothetical protein [Planctomycetia bacterium]
MNTLIILIVVIITSFLSLASVFMLLSNLGRSGRRGKVIGRLDRIRDVRISEEAEPTGLTVSGKKNWFISMLMSLGLLIYPRNEVKRKRLERTFHAAGIYDEDAVLALHGLKIFAPSVLFVMVLALSLRYIHSLPLLILIPMCSVGLGIGVPIAIIRSMGRKRKREFVLGFPDALDLIAVCAEAGVGFDAAIKKVAEEMEMSHKHIAKEFQLYIYEQQVGISRHEALRNLARRVNADIINSFVSVLIQSDKLGTGIVQTLRVYSDSLRTERRQTAEIKAARLPIYLVFPLMFLMLPSMFLVILGPAVLSISKNLLAE